MNTPTKEPLLSGFRPTGPLHLGHYVGAIKNLVELQKEPQYGPFYFLIADYQVLTDHPEKAQQVPEFSRAIAMDAIAAGLDPEKVHFVVESQIPQIAELTLYFCMIVTVAQMRRNPTIKAEAAEVGIDAETDKIRYGFLGFPIIQAADILAFRAKFIPVGEDQLPHIEASRDIAKKFNNTFGELFPLPEALVAPTARLLGLDGQKKMSKSLNNAVFLSDDAATVEKKIMKAYTDPNKVHEHDPSDPEKSAVFAMYKALFPEIAPQVEKETREGLIGSVADKKRLAGMVNDFLEPMRARRKPYEADPALIDAVLDRGTKAAQAVARETLARVRKLVYNY